MTPEWQQVLGRIRYLDGDWTEWEPVTFETRQDTFDVVDDWNTPLRSYVAGPPRIFIGAEEFTRMDGFEWQFKVGDERIHLAAGETGGYVLTTERDLTTDAPASRMWMEP